MAAPPIKTDVFIQQFLVDHTLLKLDDKYFYRNGDYPFSFYVHASLITKLEKRLNEMFPSGGWEMYEKILQFGNKQLDMYLIIILRGSTAQLQVLHNLIRTSQHSFPLEENPKLFSEARHFDVVMKFITKHKLEPYTIKMEEMIGISAEDVTIKVVTFDNTDNQKLDIIEECHTMFRKEYMARKYLYITYCLSWDCLPILRKGHIDNKFWEVFPIILQHLETINYTNELNIFDLLSLRLAISDVRGSLQTSFMKWEIKREIAKYIKNNIFDLQQYLVDKNCEYHRDLCGYLIYEFQDCFKAVHYDNKGYSTGTKVKDCIKLKSETNVLNKIKPRFNVEYSIDGDDFDQMSSSLFFGLLKCKNVEKIDLDTNYRWIKDAPNIIRIVADSRHVGVLVTFDGKNTYNFVEDCIAEIKRLEFHRISLEICCRLSDYSIFDDLDVEVIHFEATRVNRDMLHQCCTTSLLMIEENYIVNNWRAWERLNNSEDLKRKDIIEGEGTWKSMFQFVEKELLKTHSNVFQFALDIKVRLKDFRVFDINVKDFKFTFEMSQFKIRRAESNELVDDWFNVVNYVEPDENFDFEFYQ